MDEWYHDKSWEILSINDNLWWLFFGGVYLMKMGDWCKNVMPFVVFSLVIHSKVSRF